MGASLAAALTEAGEEVWGCDRRDLEPLRERGWIARQVPPEALVGAAVVILALPPQAVIAALRRFPFRRGQVLTDTASVKDPIARAARGLPAGVAFVGGHPLAGGTGQGYEAARADLFAGAPWVVTPGPAAARERVEELVRSAGAEPVSCEAVRHDRIVALTSHLPQLLAAALAAELAALDDPLAAVLVGTGGRGMLRLAASPWELWREILGLNGEAVERALAAVVGRASQPAEGLADDFRAARRWAASLVPERSPGDLSS